MPVNYYLSPFSLYNHCGRFFQSLAKLAGIRSHTCGIPGSLSLPRWGGTNIQQDEAQPIPGWKNKGWGELMFILFYFPSNRILSLSPVHSLKIIRGWEWDYSPPCWSPGWHHFLRWNSSTWWTSSWGANLLSWHAYNHGMKKNASNAKIDQIVCGNNFPFRE